MSKEQRIFVKVLWVFAIIVGVSLIVLGPVGAFRELTPASGAETNFEPNVGSVLSPEVAMGVGLFGFGLMIVHKGYSKIRFRPQGI